MHKNAYDFLLDMSNAKLSGLRAFCAPPLERCVRQGCNLLRFIPYRAATLNYSISKEATSFSNAVTALLNLQD